MWLPKTVELWTQQDAQILSNFLSIFGHIFMPVLDDCSMEVPKHVAHSG